MPPHPPDGRLNRTPGPHGPRCPFRTQAYNGALLGTLARGWAPPQRRAGSMSWGKRCGEAAGPGSLHGWRGSWPIDAHRRLGLGGGGKQGSSGFPKSRKSARNPQRQTDQRAACNLLPSTPSPLSFGSTETALRRLVRLLGGRPLDRRAASCATTAPSLPAPMSRTVPSRQAPDAVARGCETCDINKQLPPMSECCTFERQAGEPIFMYGHQHRRKSDPS